MKYTHYLIVFGLGTWGIIAWAQNNDVSISESNVVFASNVPHSDTSVYRYTLDFFSSCDSKHLVPLEFWGATDYELFIFHKRIPNVPLRICVVTPHPFKVHSFETISEYELFVSTLPKGKFYRYRKCLCPFDYGLDSATRDRILKAMRAQHTEVEDGPCACDCFSTH